MPGPLIANDENYNYSTKY